MTKHLGYTVRGKFDSLCQKKKKKDGAEEEHKLCPRSIVHFHIVRTEYKIKCFTFSINISKLMILHTDCR